MHCTSCVVCREQASDGSRPRRRAKLRLTSQNGVRIFNAEIIEAMNEAEAVATGPDAKSYSSFSELLEELG